MECLLPYISMVDVPHKMVGLERMLDYRGVGLDRFHYNYNIILLSKVYVEASSEHLPLAIQFNLCNKDTIGTTVSCPVQ